ncbi:hypothetical protein L1D15_21380 [Vibrio sp. Isolate25]|uniref:hypothetical protein n=1 Tax=Vibrio sp. Isolate25 TaxID=2908535 RepID=UPI001EFCE595|nr:hypothetical protein [Vibrio sp. Isolate25]MCG9599245.1 hypothetical protein [Vibrio sp. Isolate25]
MWLELFQVKVSFNWQALMLAIEYCLFLSALVQVYSLEVRYLNLVGFLLQRTTAKIVTWLFSASVVIAVQLALVFHGLVL